MVSLQEDSEKFWANKKTEDEQRRNTMDRSNEIFKLFKANKLLTITPLWNTLKEEINLSKQRDSLRNDLLADGYTIINKVNFETLLDCMDPVNAAMFRKKKLYSTSFEKHNIGKVIDHWLNETKLIPPTIIVNDETINKNFHYTTELYPADGKHRLNVAYFFGATAIPIFVINKQLLKIKGILNIP